MSIGGAPDRRATVARAAASSGDSTATQASGSPCAAASAAARRSAAVLPTPSSVICAFDTPARVAIDHSPRETTFAPKPWPATAATIGPTSFALTEYWRMIGSGNADVTAAHASARVTRSVTKTGVPNRVAAVLRESPNARSPDGSVANDRPDGSRDHAQHDGADDRG